MDGNKLVCETWELKVGTLGLEFEKIVFVLMVWGRLLSGHSLGQLATRYVKTPSFARMTNW